MCGIQEFVMESFPKPNRGDTTVTDTATAMTLAEMQSSNDAIASRIEAIQTVLNDKLAEGPAAAQAARLVAFAMAKQAYAMAEQLGESLQYLSRPEVEDSDETDADGAEGGLFEALIEMAEGVAEMMAEQFGVEPEAIQPFIYETCTTMIPVIEGLLDKAEAKLADADRIAAEAA